MIHIHYIFAQKYSFLQPDSVFAFSYLYDYFEWLTMAVLCRHVVKLEKEAVDLGLIATTSS